jgi:hypothetical protein
LSHNTTNSDEILPAIERAPTRIRRDESVVRDVTRPLNYRRRAARRAALAYAELVQLYPIKAKVSYTSVPGTTTQLKERLSVVFGVLSSLGLANVRESPLTLRGLLIEHAFVSGDELARDIGRHYQDQVMVSF